MGRVSIILGRALHTSGFLLYLSLPLPPSLYVCPQLTVRLTTCRWVPRYGDVSAAVPVTPAMSKASSVAALPGGAVTTLLSGPGAVTIQNAGGDSVDVVVTAGMSRDDFAKQVQAALWQVSDPLPPCF